MTRLNPGLHDRLQATCGNVRVANAGCRASVRTVQPAQQAGFTGRAYTHVTQDAERYYVNCPFCGDQRRRLSVHYLYGTVDPLTNRRFNRLLKCFNENCLAEYKNCLRFQHLVFGGSPLVSSQIPVTKLARPASGRGEWESETHTLTYPRECDRINHAAAKLDTAEYLRRRQFDPERLWKRWGVMYCRFDGACRPRVCERIVAPYYHPLDVGDPDSEVRLVGWIARQVWGNGGRQQKYLMPSGFEKSKYLYGLTQVIRTNGPVVVVEGITDVWRLTTNAVALIGTVCSAAQTRLLRKLASQRPIVLFLDDDAQDKANVIRSELQRSGCSNVCIAQPPLGRQDVGECTTEEAWAEVARALGMTVAELDISLERPPCTKHPDLTPFIERIPA